MSGYGLTYKSTMCFPNFMASKFVAIFIFTKKKKSAISLKFVYHCKKCSLFYFISYRCLNLYIALLVPWSRQIESVFYIGELVSHSDFHGGPLTSNLYDSVGDGHNLHYDVHVWTRVWCMGPTTKKVVIFVYMAQLCCPVGQVGQPSEQLYITTKM